MAADERFPTRFPAPDAHPPGAPEHAAFAALKTYPFAHGVAVATVGNLAINLLCGRPVMKGLEHIVACSDHGLMGYEDAHTVTTVVPLGVPLPSQEFRRYSATILRERQIPRGLYITVLEGEGFWAGAMRMMAAGLEQIAKTPGSVRHASTFEQALEVAYPQLVDVPTHETLLKQARAWIAWQRVDAGADHQGVVRAGG